MILPEWPDPAQTRSRGRAAWLRLKVTGGQC